jgi:hypothetical protein
MASPSFDLDFVEEERAEDVEEALVVALVGHEVQVAEAPQQAEDPMRYWGSAALCR